MILGTTQPDPVGEILGTSFQKFMRPDGVGGLAKVRDSRLDILAITSELEGRGRVRNFFREAKREFDFIYVWEISNPVLYQALTRYGFSPCYEPHSFNGKIEWSAGMLFENCLLKKSVGD